MAIPLKTKPDEQDIQMLDYSNAVNQLISSAKKELEDIKNQIIYHNVQVTMLKDKIIKDTNEIERWKREEKQKFTNETHIRQNDIIAKQNAINLHVQQQEQITRDLQLQNQRFESLNADRLKLKEDMVSLEGKKIQAQDMLTQAESIRADALNSKNQVNMLHQEALQLQEKNKQENIRLVNLNDAIENTRKKNEEQFKTLSDLKEFVEPKLRAIKEEKEALEAEKKDIVEKTSQLNNKIQEEKILLQSVLDKKADLEKDTKKFLSEKEEFTRHQLLSRGK